MSDDLARALRRASDAAYRAVRKPVEGTMLTAIRELAEEAEAGGDLAARGRARRRLRRRTRELLPVLTEAGVVDAGAAGLVEIVRGIVAALDGRAAAGGRPSSRRRARPSSRSTRSSRSSGTAPSSSSRATASTPTTLERELEPLGDSLLVVGDPIGAQGARPHRRPGPRALARRRARDDRGRRDREHARADARARAAPAAGGARPADADRARRRGRAGAGNRRLFESLGAHVVDGGHDDEPVDRRAARGGRGERRRRRS